MTVKTLIFDMIFLSLLYVTHNALKLNCISLLIYHTLATPMIIITEERFPLGVASPYALTK